MSEIKSSVFALVRRQYVRPVFLFTLLGAILRLLFIQSPALWGDETLTYGRVCGTYRQLLDVLQLDAFGPLHYEWYWLIGRVFYLTPVVMRATPIVAGILTVPAMYFLARQLVSYRTANLVALITACSAYMLVYSRDAKMYPHFWLFLILSMAFYLRWLRRGDRIDYLAWLASAIAMVGLHTLGLIVLGLLPVMQLTAQRVDWKKSLLTLIGLCIILSGPVVYYAKFSKSIDKRDDEGLNQGTGTAWVEGYNRGRDGKDHLLYLTTAWLFSWEWPQKTLERQIDPEALIYLKWTAIALILLPMIGLLPWPRRAGARPVFKIGWRVGLWLVLWLVAPIYAFYCRSVRGFDSPWIIQDHFMGRWLAVTLCVIAGAAVIGILWPRAGAAPVALGLVVVMLALHGVVLPVQTGGYERAVASLIVVFGAVGVANCADDWPGRALSTARFAAAIALVFGICVVIYHVCTFFDFDSGSIWMPRYIAVAWPAFAIGLCALVMRIPSRALRMFIIGIFIVANIQRFSARVVAAVNVDPDGKWVVTGVEPPMNLIARDIIDSDTMRRQTIGQRTVEWTPRSSTRTYVQHQIPGEPSPGAGNIMGNAGRYYLSILGQTPLTPREFRFGSYRSGDYFYAIRPTESPVFVEREMRNNPAIDRIIVWDRIEVMPAISRPDLLIRELGPQWEFISEQEFPIRAHWTWSEMGLARRREYIKRPPIPAQRRK